MHNIIWHDLHVTCHIVKDKEKTAKKRRNMHTAFENFEDKV